MGSLIFVAACRIFSCDSLWCMMSDEISEENLASRSGTRLDYSELLCGRRTEKASDIGIRRGTESAPLTSLSKGAI